MLDDLIKERIKKVSQLRKSGIDPYPEKTQRQFSIVQALDNFNDWSRRQKKIYLAGRIWSIRGHGGAVFADIKDQTGKIQLLFKLDKIGEEKMKFFQDFFDLGDFVEAQGVLFKTSRGEKTLEVRNFKMLSKSLRALPKKCYGLEDQEERLRRRYLDLLENDEVKERFVWRSKIIFALREFLNHAGYQEVETPVLQTLYGGAFARPFVTRLEALKMKIYLRIAPELYLKRLVVGGWENIYEIGKCFRNEGIDREHNPEFTLLELYSAYKTGEDLMKLTEKLFKFLAKKFKKELPAANVLLRKKWHRVDLEKFLEQETGLNFQNSAEEWWRQAQSLGLDAHRTDAKEKTADLIFKKLRDKIQEPTFIINHPVAISPLAKKKSDDAEKTARFQFILSGLEIVNGFSELNDPIDQKNRFQEQERLRKKGDMEAHPQDADYIEALEYGMPPTAGLGIGIDRMIAAFTGSSSLKEVILFPFMKPRNKK